MKNKRQQETEEIRSMVVEEPETCGICDGTGLFANRKCKDCDGKGYKQDN